jgi:hypothetical protein
MRRRKTCCSGVYEWQTPRGTRDMVCANRAFIGNGWLHDSENTMATKDIWT